MADPATVVCVGGLDGRIGFVVVGAARTAPTGWLLSRLSVDPYWWGRGICGRRGEVAVSAGASLGARAINLWALEHNAPARDVYERRGWRLAKGQRRRVSAVGGVSDVLYAKLL